MINFSIVPAERGAGILRSLYPHAKIRVDERANAVIILANAYDEQGMRAIASGIDIKNPTDTVTDAYQLKVLDPRVVIDRVRGVFPRARFVAAPNRTILILAAPQDMQQVKAVIAAIDTLPPTPTPRPQYPSEAVTVTQGNPREIARAVAAETQNIRISVSHDAILLSGPPDQVQNAKALIVQLDVPQAGTQYTQVYHLNHVDANSVADLFRRSFPGLQIAVDADLNAMTITANIATQRRLADAIAQLDSSPQDTQGVQGQSGGVASGAVVINLKAAVPGLQGGPSSSASEIANTVTQALQSQAPDLHIIVPPNSTRLVLTGSAYSIKLAEQLIDQLDVPEPLVALDTEVLEVDEGVAKQLGLKFPTAALTTTYTELTPTAQSSNYTAAQLLGLQPLTRTPLSLGAELDFLISNSYAKVLEDPRLTTISGRTASLRAGETLNILTTTGGGTGTVATTQVQSFQTGVTLDITPVVNDGDYITVTLHPTVNSIAASSGSVPDIQTRDTTTTVGLRDGQTLVIGGLIEDDQSRTVQKIPFLGDLPLIGRALFTDTTINDTRNELIVTVTPHILRADDNGSIGKNHIGIPRPEGLPTLPPDTPMPRPRDQLPPQPLPAHGPEPITVPTPTSGFTPGPLFVTPPPTMSVAPAHTASAQAPQPLPSAFGQTNVYTFGSPPANNYASSNQPGQIFFVQMQPSVVSDGQQMTLSVITTTNITKLVFGENAFTPMTTLSSVGNGQWQSTFTFSAAGLSSAPSQTLILTATTVFGAAVHLPVPVTVIGR